MPTRRRHDASQCRSTGGRHPLSLPPTKLGKAPPLGKTPRRDARQTELLLDAGLDRAAFQLSQRSAYEGETWTIPADQLLDSGDGEVVIAVTRRGDADVWRVRVDAEYPVGALSSVRRTRTFFVQD
jgi:hypothetical protein